jgi:hypothetical protein
MKFNTVGMIEKVLSIAHQVQHDYPLFYVICLPVSVLTYTDHAASWYAHDNQRWDSSAPLPRCDKHKDWAANT